MFKKENMKNNFKLLKNFDGHKMGKIFESFGGLIRGVEGKKTGKKINFDNKDFFKTFN